MSYFDRSSVTVVAWVAIAANSEITYHVYPAVDTVEFSLGGDTALDLQMSEAGLRRCVSVFSSALDALHAAATPQPDASSPGGPS